MEEEKKEKKIKPNEIKEFAIGIILLAIGLFMLSMRVRVHTRLVWIWLWRISNIIWSCNYSFNNRIGLVFC